MASSTARVRSARRGGAAGLAGTLALGLGVAWAPAAAAADGGVVVAWGHDGEDQTAVPDGLTDVVDLAAGHEHGVALRADGTVVAWGDDGAGQATVPDGLTDVVDVAASSGASFALLDDGTVIGWGNDVDGESDPPDDLTDVVAVDGGASFALALRADGTVVGWGEDTDGRATPPADLTDAVAVAAGGTHALALRSDGAVVAWGWNGYGQTDVPADLTDVVAVGAGTAHSLAVRADGTVAVWGGNFSGQADVPADLTDVVAVDGGVHFSIALRADGTVVAWGEESELTEVPAGLVDVTRVAAGGSHTLAVVGGGDDEAPVIDVPDDVTRTAVSAKGARVAWPRVTATDDGPGAVRVRCDPRSGSHVDVGETTVTCTASDQAGNTTTATFTVTLAYEWSGWRPPIEPEVGPVLEAGRVVPVRFSLTGPSRWAHARATLWYAPVAADGTVGELLPAAAPERRRHDVGDQNVFAHSPRTGHFWFPWSTAGLAPGAYEVSIELGDDQRRTERITLR